MIVKLRKVGMDVYVDMSAESEDDRKTLTTLDKEIGHAMKFSVDWSAGRPDGTIGALTLGEYHDDPRE